MRPGPRLHRVPTWALGTIPGQAERRGSDSGPPRPQPQLGGIRALFRLHCSQGRSLKIQTGKTSVCGLKPQEKAQITVFNQNHFVWPQNGLWPPKSCSSSLAKTPSWTRRAPGTAAPGPFRCFCPVSSSAVPAAAPGRVPRAGRALWGLLEGVSGHLVVSPSAWEVLEQQDEPEMSQPCQCHKHQGCGDSQDPGVGAGDCRLCHSMPACASGPESLLLMCSPPTIDPFPPIPCSHPIKAAFCSTNTHLGPQE